MGTTDARRVLLGQLIDHAPTFPPALLAPDAALAEDERAVASSSSFVLGRLVWRASGLGLLASSRRPVSAVLDAPVPEGAAVEAVEATYREDLDSLACLAPEVFVEVALADGLEGRLDRLAGCGFRAKVRCGGEVVPDVAALAEFVRACRERRLPFKATAGLHHAVCTNGEHGFLNLLAAVTFEGDEEAVLSEQDASAFSLDAGAFAWRDRSATAAELERVRSETIRSIGSCSFFEPVEELELLGVLPL
ncbi:MAG TPA: hypothetical protein VFU99_03860 [Gaiellaceae bacterium]|nr:hypothetical protein [Gaiellaceae bacterium]